MNTEAHIEAMAEARAIADGSALPPRPEHITALLSVLRAQDEAIAQLQTAIRFVAQWDWEGESCKH